MSNFDDIFAGQSGGSQWRDNPFNKEEWAAKKQEERKEVYELADTTAVEISKDGEKFRKFLDVQARFDRYSPTNALLIYAQMPEATQLKDFDGWKDAGVSVQRKPKSVKILEPGKEYNREDGSRGTSFEVKRVYDVSQTKGRVRSAPNVKLDDRVLLKALISRTPVPIQTVESLPNNMGALYDHDQQVIFVCKGMGAEDIFRSVSKELAHAEIAGMSDNYNRNDAAFKAYSASYLLCKKYQIGTADYNFSRLPASFRESDAQGVRAALTEIRDSANQISQRMYRALDQNRNTRGKEQER